MIALFALIAVASATYNGNYWMMEGNDGVMCFPDRCETCENHLGENYGIFDCEGQCGLCALCNAATIPVVAAPSRSLMTRFASAAAQLSMRGTK